jgi:hypothetical protein
VVSEHGAGLETCALFLKRWRKHKSRVLRIPSLRILAIEAGFNHPSELCCGTFRKDRRFTNQRPALGTLIGALNDPQRRWKSLAHGR